MGIMLAARWDHAARSLCIAYLLLSHTVHGFQNLVHENRGRSSFTAVNRPPSQSHHRHVVSLSSSSTPLDNSNTLNNNNKNNNKRNSTFLELAIRGPPIETKPDYDKIVGPLGRIMDRIFLIVFRRALAHHAQFDSPRSQDDFMGIIDIALHMNKQYKDRNQVQQRALQVLQSLFPKWMPPAYAKLFSKPFPAFSSKMNAWATKVAGTWLMGECEINNVIVDGGNVGINQGLLVKRCRFMEESGCASVCVNSCKLPTQTFFMQEMGLPLTMEPNYETFECQFSFGKSPDEQGELDAKNIPCLMRCPTAGSIRALHKTNSASGNQKVDNTGSAALTPCELMENRETK